MQRTKKYRFLVDKVTKMGEVNKDILIDILKKDVELPPLEKLQKQYLSKLLNQIMAGDRDENGKRNIHALRTRANCEYVSLITGSKIKLERIHKHLIKEWNAMGETVDKVERAIQMTLFDEGQVLQDYGHK